MQFQSQKFAMPFANIINGKSLNCVGDDGTCDHWLTMLINPWILSGWVVKKEHAEIIHEEVEQGFSESSPLKGTHKSWGYLELN